MREATTIQAKDLLTGNYRYIYGAESEWEIKSVTQTEKFVVVEIQDNWGMGWKTGTVKKRLKKTMSLLAA